MNYIAVALAGFFGAITRAALSDFMSAGISSSFPLHTLVVNITGCFVLSFFMNITMDRFKINSNLRLGIGTGFLGAYTTFSTFAVESIDLLLNNLPWLSLLYILSTAIGCILSAWLGMTISSIFTQSEGTLKTTRGK